MNVYKQLREKGLKCNCADCDAFGCDSCTVCKIDEEDALKLLNDLNTIEFKYKVKIQTVLNAGAAYEF